MSILLENATGTIHVDLRVEIVVGGSLIVLLSWLLRLLVTRRHKAEAERAAQERPHAPQPRAEIHTARGEHGVIDESMKDTSVARKFSDYLVRPTSDRPPPLSAPADENARFPPPTRSMERLIVPENGHVDPDLADTVEPVEGDSDYIEVTSTGIRQVQGAFEPDEGPTQPFERLEDLLGQ